MSKALESSLVPAAIIGGAALFLAMKKKGVSGVGSVYEDEANDFARRYGVRLSILGEDYRKHFEDDVRPRAVYKCRLTRGGKSYTFDFGASYADPSEPSMYDVLAALTKYDPGDFSDFCADYGYEEYSEDPYTGRYGVNKSAMRIYRAVVKEYQAVDRLFGDVMDELSEIA